VAGASVMPYLGNAYLGLSAVAGTDYFRTDNEPSGAGIYRNADLNPPVPMGVNAGDVNDPIQVYDLVRAMDAGRNITWQMEANFSLGWAGSGRWFNYTRDIPNGVYQIWAGMSHGGTGQMAGDLARIVGSASVPGAEQVQEPLGQFRAPVTGGWGNNRLVPLRDAESQAITEVSLGGTTTLRWNWIEGDFDYLMLVPTAITPPPGLIITAISIEPTGQLRIAWDGEGTLQSSPAIPATQWTDVTSTSPALVDPPATGNLFFQVAQ
jgi:hypothetical protein